MRLLAVLGLMLLVSAAAHAGRLYCPRVTSEHNADTTDLRRFRNFHAWKDKTGNELAYAVWQYLSSYETGLYHFYEVLDGPDPFVEYASMREPLKMLNVYNMGYCGIFGPTFEGILYGVSEEFTTSRSFALAAWSHCATEVFYGNEWHYFDVDVRGCLLRPAGTVASLTEARTKRELWVNPEKKSQPFFPHHSTPTKAERVFKIYEKSPVGYQYKWFQGSHTADYWLRPGESFTRWWQPRGGRWNHRASYNRSRNNWVRKLILTPPIGMKPNHRHFTPYNHGNGLFHYAPKLTADSRDFAEGVMSAKGLKPGKGGLELTAEGGEAIFEVFTPFVIVPKVNDLDNFDDDTEASVVTLNAAVPVKISVSTDNGLSWTGAGTIQPGENSLDLTKHVKGKYGYVLRLSASGEAGDAAVRSMSIDTWVQVAPISLPRLKQGRNKLRYDAGDRYDGMSAPMLVLPNVADPDDLKKYVVAMPKRYDIKRNTSRIQGPVVMKMAAPAGQKISWFSVGATFRCNQGKAAPTTANRIDYAVGEPKDFKEVYNAKGKIPTYVDHWRYNHDTDVKLRAPAEVVYVKFTGSPAVNVIRACLHLTPPTRHDAAVVITHGYKLDGKTVEREVAMGKRGGYTIDCDGKVENVFIKIAKPSK